MFFYTDHALQRMEERNFSQAMLDAAFEPLMKLGHWDQKNERLTLNTNTDDFHSYIRNISQLCQFARRELLMSRRDADRRQSPALEELKRRYKDLKSKLSNLKKLEHKGTVTLVIVHNCILTVFKRGCHFKRDV
ncbi:MAG: hypothetical protein IJ523_04205 [Succinivibrionaceae bacterium]|nr:hypothetical protein [Succinivibrionaceae bacterium]